MSPTIEILLILLLILANGLFVMSELAIVSSRKARLQQLANQGDAKARIALELASSPNQFLGTVQIGITLLTILSGAFGEETIAKRLLPILSLIPFSRQLQGTASSRHSHSNYYLFNTDSWRTSPKTASFKQSGIHSLGCIYPHADVSYIWRTHCLFTQSFY